MSHYITTQGYILRSYSVKEVDRRYLVYTKEYGKMDVLARGTRKIKSKLAGNLQPFRLLTLHVAQGKQQAHVVGVACEAAYSFTRSPQLFGYAHYCLELVDHVTKYEQKSTEVFVLLGEVLELLGSCESEQEAKKLRVTFLLKLLEVTGFSPRERVKNNTEVTNTLALYIDQPLSHSVQHESNGALKKLFALSQAVLNEVVEKPLSSAQFLQKV